MIQIAIACSNVLGEAAVWDPPTARLYWLDLMEPALLPEPATSDLKSLPLAAKPPPGPRFPTEQPDTLPLASP